MIDYLKISVQTIEKMLCICTKELIDDVVSEFNTKFVVEYCDEHFDEWNITNWIYEPSSYTFRKVKVVETFLQMGRKVIIDEIVYRDHSSLSAKLYKDHVISYEEMSEIEERWFDYNHIEGDTRYMIPPFDL